MAVGRISGPLLKENLLRDGVNLAFETDLLYLDVVHGKVGIKTTPNPLLDYDLDVNGTTRTTYLEVDTEADIASFTISSNTIASSNGTISLEPSGANPVVYQGKIVTGDLQISTNTIEVTTADQDLQFKTTGAGKVVIGTVAHNTDVLINGNLHATGNITADGDITIGDANTDNIVFNADINSHIIPDDNNTWDLGSDPTASGKEWRNLYAHTLVATTLDIEDLTVNGDFVVTGSGTFNGDVQFGDTTTDTVTFTGTVSSNIIPTTTAFYDLGTDALRWNVGYFGRVEVDNLVIDSNTISTTYGNDNLTLQANGSGRIYIPSNNVQLNQQLTVSGDTSLKATTINGNITQTGNVEQTGDYTQTGDTTITGNLTVSTFGQFEKIRIDGNEISTTATDTDLKLEADGTGIILIPNNDVQIDQNLTVNGTATINDLSVTTTITADSLSDGDILIENNSIATTLTDSDLELSANGTGIISIPTNNVQIDQQLTVNGDTTLKATTINGDITQTGNVEQTGDYTQTGDTTITGNLTVSTFGQFEKIRIDSNVVSTTATDTDLQLEADGAGKIYVPTDDVLIEQNLTVNTLATFNALEVTTQVTAASFSDGDILIENNTITTEITDSDLELSANGSGIISIPTNNVQLDQQLTVNGDTTLKATTINGDITQTGDVTQTGDYTQTGDMTVTGNLTVSTFGQFEKIRVESNVVSTTATDTDLQLEANGAGKIFVPTDDVLIDQNLTVNGTATINDLSVTTTITADSLSTSDILIENNSITTTVTDSDLELSANGTGLVLISNNDVQINQDLTVNGDTTLKATTINGNITQTGDVTQTGDYTQTGDMTVTGNLTVSTFGQFEKIRVDSNTITTTTNTDLELGANGTGKIYVPSNDVQIDQNLTVNGTATIDTLSVTTSITADSLSTGDILIENNSIATTLTDSDLELSANGAGIISIPTNNVQIDQSLTVTQDLTVTTGTTYLKDTTVVGSITQTGNIVQTGDFTTTGNTEVTGNITATGNIDLAEISIISNIISTKVSGTDLQLEANGTGNVVFEGLKVTDNTILSTATDSDITLTPQGTGKVIISSNQSLVIPTGTTSDRPLVPTNGMIRYNTDFNRYEGYSATYSTWVKLSGVEDADGNTYITAEATPGTNDNVLRFYVDSTLMSYIDATKLWATRIETDQLAIYDNQITTVVTDTDINLTTSGTGGVKIGNLKVKNNTITNTVSGAVTEFAEAGTGYVKIAGTSGVVIPAGDLSQLPSVTELGMIRFNTYYGYVEIFNGVTWVNVAGSTSGISLSQAQDIGIVSALLFG